MKGKKFQYNGKIVEISPYQVVDKGTKERKWVAKAFIITNIGSREEHQAVSGSKSYDTEKEAIIASIMIAKKCIDDD